MKEQLFLVFPASVSVWICGEEMKARPVIPELERKLKAVLGFIQEHYTETLTIEELAEVCHFSQAHFMSFSNGLWG